MQFTAKNCNSLQTNMQFTAGRGIQIQLPKHVLDHTARNMRHHEPLQEDTPILPFRYHIMEGTMAQLTISNAATAYHHMNTHANILVCLVIIQAFFPACGNNKHENLKMPNNDYLFTNWWLYYMSE